MKEQEEASKAIKSYFDNLKFIDDEGVFDEGLFKILDHQKL